MKERRTRGSGREALGRRVSRRGLLTLAFARSVTAAADRLPLEAAGVPEEGAGAADAHGRCPACGLTHRPDGAGCAEAARRRDAVRSLRRTNTAGESADGPRER